MDNVQMKDFAAAILCSFATAASAQSFIGAAIGQSDIGNGVAKDLITSGAFDGVDTGFKIYSGYMFGRHFGFEGAYVDLGDARYSGTFAGVPVTGGKVKVSGYAICALLSYPVGSELAVSGKLGLFAWEWTASDTTAGRPFETIERGNDLTFGVGAAYQFGRHLSLRAEWERFKLDDTDADLLSVGIMWRF
jgi:OmpA-OmpF porin, OOP family